MGSSVSPISVLCASTRNMILLLLLLLLAVSLTLSLSLSNLFNSNLNLRWPYEHRVSVLTATHKKHHINHNTSPNNCLASITECPCVASVFEHTEGLSPETGYIDTNVHN